MPVNVPGDCLLEAILSGHEQNVIEIPPPQQRLKTQNIFGKVSVMLLPYWEVTPFLFFLSNENKMFSNISD